MDTVVTTEHSGMSSPSNTDQVRLPGFTIYSMETKRSVEKYLAEIPVILDREDKPLPGKLPILDGTFASAKKGAKSDKTKRGRNKDHVGSFDGTRNPINFF